MAIKLSGGVPEISLCWVNQTTFKTLPNKEQTKDGAAIEALATLKPDQAIWIDYLMEGPSDPYDNNDGNKPNLPSVKITWDLPMVNDTFGISMKAYQHLGLEG